MSDTLWYSITNEIFAEGPLKYIEPTTLAKQFGATPADVLTTIDALGYMNAFWKRRGIDDDWRNWLGYEWAFRQMVISRRRIPSAGDKMLFAELAFILLEDQTPRPLTREIERLGEGYLRIRDSLSLELPDSGPEESDGLTLLGTAKVDHTPFLLAAELRSNPRIKRLAAELLHSLCATNGKSR